MDKVKQLQAICREMIANGHREVRSHVPAPDLGLTIDLDIIANEPDGKGRIIVEMVDRDRPEDESIARHQAISEAIKDRPEIAYELRFYDYSQEMLKAWVALRRKIGAKIKKGEDVAALEGVLDMMDTFKKTFAGF